MTLRSEIIRVLKDHDIVINTEVKAHVEDFIDTVNDETASADSEDDEEEEG